LPRVLIIDDDRDLRNVCRVGLEAFGYEVLTAASAQDGLAEAAVRAPDVIVLDLGLPDMDGIELCRRIRTWSEVPVVVLSADGSEDRKVDALGDGADDYMTKPFGLRELLARIRAVLRRQELGRVASHRETEQGRFRFSGWQLDRRTRRLTDPNGAPVALTKGEYTLLTAFLDAPQRPLSREHLLQATRIHEDVFDRSIDVQILRLRRKLETDSSAPRIIRTERGVGYVFVPQVEQI